MIIKVKKLKEIESSKVRNKLPLPILKEKLDIIKNLIAANRELLNIINYDDPFGAELADILNDMSILLTKANVAESSVLALRNYDIVLAILEGFTYEPDSELS